MTRPGPRRPRAPFLRAAPLAAIALLSLAGPALADAGETFWRDHPGAGVAAVAGIAVLVVLGVAGLGAAVAVLGAAAPRLQAAMADQARRGGGLLSGSLLVVGLVAAAAALAQVGTAGQLVGALLALIGAGCALAGALGTLPLLGERLLGKRGEAASPLARSVVGALALGLAAFPAVALRLWPLAFLLLLVATGWPAGVALDAFLRRRTAKRAKPAGS